MISDETVALYLQYLDANPGDRADLRRARSLDEIEATMAFHRLRHMTKRYGVLPSDDIAGVAILLCRVKKALPLQVSDQETEAYALGRYLLQGPHPLTRRRLDKLCAQRQARNVLHNLVDVLSICRGRVPAGALVRVFLRWPYNSWRDVASGYLETLLNLSSN